MNRILLDGDRPPDPAHIPRERSPQQFDHARVLATRTALHEGSYRPDARRIAAAFLRIERPDVGRIF